MGRLNAAAQALETRFVQQFAAEGSVSLFVGLACNLAFAGQVFFWPAMWHTSVFTISYTDASYVGQLIGALALIVYFRQTGRTAPDRATLWASALTVQLTLVAYFIFFQYGVDVPDLVHWLFGALFGAYLPITLVAWIGLFIGAKPSHVMWDIMLSAMFAAFVIWLFSGLDGLKICVCMGILIVAATAILTHKLHVQQPPALDAGQAETRWEYSYSAPATFLFSVAFVIAVSFASVDGERAAFSTGAFFAPMLVVCVLLLFVNQVGFPLSSVAVPAIVTATIAASSMHFDPALSFDIAALGMFLFLAFAVVLLCSRDFGERQRQIREFLFLMVAFASGCLVGRVIVAACVAWAGGFASEVLVLVSIVAAFTAMIILIRKGVTQQKAQQLFKVEEAETAAHDKEASYQVKIDDVVERHGIGDREREVLELLLEGNSASEVARRLVIANGTAKSHIRHVYKKLDIHNRDELFAIFSLDAPLRHRD